MGEKIENLNVLHGDMNNPDKLLNPLCLYLQIYNPKLDMWTQSVQLNSYRIGFCAVVSQNQEELYIVGGIDKNGEKKRLESLNFETMEWTRLGDMYTERSDCACTTFKDDLIVAGLYFQNQRIVKQFAIFI